MWFDQRRDYGILKAFHVFCVPVMKDLSDRAGVWPELCHFVISSYESFTVFYTSLQSPKHAAMPLLILLQYVAICCNMLQYVAMPFHGDAFVLVLS